MIVVKLMGGLGNQMFQYAAARRLAHSNAAEVKFDAGWFDNIPSTATVRKYELGVFNVACCIATPGEVRSVRGIEIPPYFPRVIKRTLKAVGYGERSGCTKEKNFSFDSAILDLRGDIYLDGYWQSEKYFHDIAGIIRQEFTLKHEAEGSNLRMLDQIRSCNAVSLHVRRGDYVTNKTNSEFHGTASLDYYHAAIARITGSTLSPKFFVFSDDPEWVKANLKFSQSAIYVDFNGPAAPGEDLRLMSACKHHIIANSSFSWWGAWLNNKADRIVIAPRNWFASDLIDVSDLIPKTWETI
jgi:hypothetical protein